jgi:hypothetical protein
MDVTISTLRAELSTWIEQVARFGLWAIHSRLTGLAHGGLSRW